LIRLRYKARDALIAIPVSLDLVPVSVETAAAVAMREILWIIILKCFHEFTKVIINVCIGIAVLAYLEIQNRSDVRGISQDST